MLACPLSANSDRTQRSKKSLLNHLVGAPLEIQRHIEAECPALKSRQQIQGVNVSTGPAAFLPRCQTA